MIVFQNPVQLNCHLIWAEIHDLPEAYGPMAKLLAVWVRQFQSNEVDSMDLFGNYCHLQVKIDVREPLK
jgi:hypothetical protein